MEKIIVQNREAFSIDKEKMETFTRKYWTKLLSKVPETKYDHALMYRDEDTDYLLISPYPGIWKEGELEAEGFKEIPPVYSTSCKSYVKTFKRTRSQKIQEKPNKRVEREVIG